MVVRGAARFVVVVLLLVLLWLLLVGPVADVASRLPFPQALAASGQPTRAQLARQVRAWRARAFRAERALAAWEPCASGDGCICQFWDPRVGRP